MNKHHAPMRNALLNAFAAGLVLLVASPALHAQKKNTGGTPKKLYCWDEGGRKVCGDALPASAVNSARTEISARSGMTTATIGRALTAEERAEAAEDEHARRLTEAREAAKVRRERAMAESYSTEAELRRAYRNRIVLLDETVKASKLGIEGLRRSLLALLRRAGEAELTGTPVARKLAGNIHGQHRQLLHQQAMLAQQQQERREVGGELEAALARYRELKG